MSAQIAPAKSSARLAPRVGLHAYPASDHCSQLERDRSLRWAILTLPGGTRQRPNRRLARQTTARTTHATSAWRQGRCAACQWLTILLL